MAKNYNIIFEKLDELNKEEMKQDVLGEDSDETRTEFDEINELCKLSHETKEQNPCFFTTT